MNRTIGNAILVLTIACASRPAISSDYPQWRGPQRNGISTETRLLQEWPEGGPKLRWQVTDLGSGYAAPAFARDRLYVLANEGLENEFVRALSAADGARLWQTRLGNVGNPKQDPNFPAARSTPTVEGELLWALGSDGDLACLETATGSVRWRKNLRTDFVGKPGTWAYSESPLVDGDSLICTPGGAEATIVALHKMTGEVLWKSALAEAGDAAYASPVMVETGGLKQYVQLLQKGLFGVDGLTGRLLWRYAKATSRYDANIPTPLVGDGCVYVASAGTGAGVLRLEVSADTAQTRELYFGPKYPWEIGGVIKLGDHLYGTTARTVVCLDFLTGATIWEENALGAASLCFADGRLYLHLENGDVALIEPSPDSYRPKGRFTPPDQPKRKGPMEKAWAYPVVAGGGLYIRDHNLLWCYDVRRISGQ